MILVVSLIFVVLLLVMSVITNIQYYLKNERLKEDHIKEKKEWNFSQKEKNSSIDEYLLSLKTRFKKEYKSLHSGEKKGYIKGYYKQGAGTLNERQVETINYITILDEYESGDLKVSLDNIEYIKHSNDNDGFSRWIRDNFITLIQEEDKDVIIWLVSKNKLNKSRDEKIKRLLDFVNEEKDDYDEDNKKISKDK